MAASLPTPGWGAEKEGGGGDPNAVKRHRVLIRTPDPQIRSLVLYPAELRARTLRNSRQTAAKRGQPYTGANGLSSMTE
jgi:hypothetical protein